MERVKTSLESEQEKLATLVKNLSADPSQMEAAGEQKGEEPISKEWLQSLKERRKVEMILEFAHNLILFIIIVIVLIFCRSCWSRSVIVTRGRRNLERGGVLPPRIA